MYLSSFAIKRVEDAHQKDMHAFAGWDTRPRGKVDKWPTSPWIRLMRIWRCKRPPSEARDQAHKMEGRHEGLRRSIPAAAWAALGAELGHEQRAARRPR
jgi:hypothetical protein